MKNTNLKLNKTKLIARLMVVVLLLISVFNLSACGRTQKYMYVAKHNLYGNRYVIQSSLWTDNDDGKDVELKQGMQPGVEMESYEGGYIEDWAVIAYGKNVNLYNVFNNGLYWLKPVELETSLQY